MVEASVFVSVSRNVSRLPEPFAVSKYACAVLAGFQMSSKVTLSGVFVTGAYSSKLAVDPRFVMVSKFQVIAGPRRPTIPVISVGVAEMVTLSVVPIELNEVVAIVTAPLIAQIVMLCRVPPEKAQLGLDSSI